MHPFTLLWPTALFFHFQWSYIFSGFASSVEQISALFAFVCIITFIAKPNRVSFSILNLSIVLDVYINLPDIPNHWLLSGLLALNFLILTCTEKEANLNSLISSNKTLQTSFLYCLIIFYFFAFFWKLNHDFLGTDGCAVVFTRMFLPQIKITPSIQYALSIATLLVEALIPLLLLLRPWKKVALFIALSLHMILLLPVEKFFLNFSFLMLAFWSLQVDFTTLRISKKIADPQTHNKLKIIFAGAMLLLLMLGAHWDFPWFIARQVVASTLYISFFLLLVKNFNQFRMQNSAIFLKPAAILVPILIWVNGITPILGYKNASAWQMYSNISIDNLSSNHFLLPRSLDLGGFLADRVSITKFNSLNNPILSTQTAIKAGREYPYYFIQKFCSKYSCKETRYLRGDRLYKTDGNKERLEFEKLNSILRKILRFEPYNLNGQTKCTW